MFRKKVRTLGSKTPKWFKDWNDREFREVATRSSRNEKLIYVILGSVVILNTAGNWYHQDIMNFIIGIFS